MFVADTIDLKSSPDCAEKRSVSYHNDIDPAARIGNKEGEWQHDDYDDDDKGDDHVL